MKKKTMKALSNVGVQAFLNDAYVNALARSGFTMPNVANDARWGMTRLTKNYNLLNALYRNSWIVRKGVDIVARDMLKNWLDLTSNITPEENDHFKRVVRNTRVRTSLKEAICWARLYGGAACIMLIEGQEDILDEPLDIENIKTGDFKGLLTLDRWSGIYPELETIDDISSPEFGLPKYYQIKTDDGEVQRVHYTRVLRFIGDPLPRWEKIAETYWGASVVEASFEEFKKRENTSHNLENLVFSSNLSVLKLKDQSILSATLNQKSKQNLYNVLQAQNTLKNNQSLMVLDKEDDYQNFQYSFAGLPDLYELFMLDIAGSWDIPATIFFGRSPQGMNSTGEGERSNYYNKIESNQESDLRPQLDKLMPVMGKSAWGYIPDDLDFEFRSVETALQKDKAEQTWRSTEAIRGAFVDGIISQKVAQKELKSLGDEIGLFTNITDEDISQASNEVTSPFDDIGEVEPIDDYMNSFTNDAEFNETDHPRNKDGKFTNGSGKKGNKTVAKLYSKAIIKKNKRQGIRLPKKEYSLVMHELNTTLTKEQQKKKIIRKYIGNHRYTVQNNGFNEYIILKREAIDDIN